MATHFGYISLAPRTHFEPQNRTPAGDEGPAAPGGTHRCEEQHVDDAAEGVRHVLDKWSTAGPRGGFGVVVSGLPYPATAKPKKTAIFDKLIKSVSPHL